jgi:hypothetical protein
MTTLIGLFKGAWNILARVLRRSGNAAQDKKARRQQTDQRLRRGAHARSINDERTQA